MANLNIVVDIVGKDIGAVSILDAVAQKAEGLGGAVATAGKALAGLAVVGAGAVVAGMGAAVTAAAGFEQQMSEVKAVSGATGEEMGKLSGLALQLGKDTSFSASEAAAVAMGALSQAEARDWQRSVAKLNAVTARLAALRLEGERLEGERPPVAVPWTVTRRLAYAMWDRRRRAHNAQLAATQAEGERLHTRVMAYVRRLAPYIESMEEASA